MKQLDIVIDMQYGSTGKGLLAGWLTKRFSHDTIMTAWGPNAGHTFIDSDGTKYVHTMLANGIVGSNFKRLLIGPGSTLNLDNLLAEVEACEHIFERQMASIFVHPHAAVVTQADRDEEEKSMVAIGSTRKGVGAAMMNKIRRNPDQKCVALNFVEHPLFEKPFVYLVADPYTWLEIMDMSNNVLVEGAQGFGLSIQHGFYPYTTSRDVTPAQIAADCGIPFAAVRRAHIYGTARTYPIRVANRHNAAGEQVGYSGPVYDDQVELEWSALGMEPELTTVTKLPRRIFTYSHQQMLFASTICGVNTVFLNFINYLKSFDDFRAIYESIERCSIGSLIYGTGPTVNDVVRATKGGPHADWEMLCDRIGRQEALL